MFLNSPNGKSLKFVDAALPHNCWVSYLCATPNFGKIGAQAATPPSIPTQKIIFMTTIIINPQMLKGGSNYPQATIFAEIS